MSIKPELILKENDVKLFQSAMETELEKPIKHFEAELVKIRTGRAHVSMIEDIMVSTAYGGAAQPLKKMAILAAPETRLLTIQPWDATIIPDIERAIIASDFGGNPVNDGKVIRINLPQISAERRDELVKVLHKKLEECRVSIRNIRKDFNNIIRDGKKDKKISENFFNRLSDVVQKVTDKYIERVEQLAKKKETDITTV